MGRLTNVGTNAAEYGAYLFLCLDVPKKRGRIGTVATVAIVSCAPGLRRIGDDHAIWAIDFRKTSSNAGASGGPDGSLQLLGERIVTAGIQHQNAQVLRRLHVSDDIVDTHHAPQVGLVA